MSKIELNVVGISSSQTQSGGYALILAEREGTRRLPIIIGVYEAQSIAIFIENMKPPRPLTHDLFKTFALEHQIIVKEVVISKFQEGIFFAEIHSIDAQGNEVITDARTSDAVAIALRFNCPIYTTEQVISQTGINFEPETEDEEEEIQEEAEPMKTGHADDLKKQSPEDLKAMLDDAISSEHYELASKIRDEINRREKQDDK